MDLSPDTQNCGLCMRRESRKRYSLHRLQRKPLVPACIMARAWRMTGSLTLGGGENVPGIPGACATRNFAYSGKRPMRENFTYAMSSSLLQCQGRAHMTHTTPTTMTSQLEGAIRFTVPLRRESGGFPSQWASDALPWFFSFVWLNNQLNKFYIGGRGGGRMWGANQNHATTSVYTVHTLFCFAVVMVTDRFYKYPPDIRHWHWDKHTMIQVIQKQPCRT